MWSQADGELQIANSHVNLIPNPCLSAGRLLLCKEKGACRSVSNPKAAPATHVVKEKHQITNNKIQTRLPAAR